MAITLYFIVLVNMTAALNVLGNINAAIGSVASSTNQILGIGTNINNTIVNWKDTSTGTTQCLSFID